MTSPKNSDAQFPVLVITAAVLLGVILWQGGFLSGIGSLGSERAPVSQSPSRPPTGDAASGSAFVFENPPLPYDLFLGNATGTGTLTPLPKPPLTEPSRVMSGLKIFEIAASVNGFVPSTLVVSVGDRVQLDVIAAGERFDIGIPGLNSYLDIPAGEQRSIGFEVTTPGEYKFSCRGYCPNGKEISGMVIVQ